MAMLVPFRALMIMSTTFLPNRDDYELWHVKDLLFIHGMLKICHLKKDPSNVFLVMQCRDWTLVDYRYNILFYRKGFVVNICDIVAILD